MLATTCPSAPTFSSRPAGRATAALAERQGETQTPAQDQLHVSGWWRGGGFAWHQLVIGAGRWRVPCYPAPSLASSSVTEGLVELMETFGQREDVSEARKNENNFAVSQLVLGIAQNRLLGEGMPA